MTASITKDINDKKKDIRTLSWYQRFWYSRQDKTIQKSKEKKK
tara:strand:+ start:166 stop:294 length:129 start_codon:yes stop_codon:yes gene_type:complete